MKSISEVLREKSSWLRQAKCSPEEAELFFAPMEEERGREAVKVAKAICNGNDDRPPCEVRAECLTYAIENNENHGVWGGLDEVERRRLVRDLRAKQRAAKKALESKPRRRIIRREERWV